MFRSARILVLLPLLLTWSIPGRAASPTPALPGSQAPASHNRLVVFEAFMRAT